MSFLSAFKKHKDADDSNIESAPTELPSLPGSDSQAFARRSDLSHDTDSTKVNEEILKMIMDDSDMLESDIKDLGGVNVSTASAEVAAPDELPQSAIKSIRQANASSNQSSLQPAVQASGSVSESTSSAVGNDSKLYFSELVRKFMTAEGKSSVEKELLSAASSEVIGAIKHQWEEDEHEKELNSVNGEILGMMQPMKTLESEWWSLKTHIEMKNKELSAKEDKIKEMTDKLKNLLIKKKDLEEKFTGQNR
ncbi:hypothetical protein H6503_02800 [Candidatus Woesearchaeota archaeon]|nr:hypothetical protein [Candidatus Woesearchaeota archaeon]